MSYREECMMVNSLSIVVPVFNEEKTISRVVSLADTVSKRLTLNYEIIVIDDGSTDDTPIILNDLKKIFTKLRVFIHKKNKGVGEALFLGYTNAKNNFIFFNSADEQILMNELEKLIPFSKEYDIVIGNRRKRQDKLQRKFLASLYHYILFVCFGLDPSWDVDSVKLYNRKVFDSIKLESHSAFIETEILLKSINNGFKITSIDIEHHPRLFGRNTGAKWYIISKQLRDLVKFKLKMLF